MKILPESSGHCEHLRRRAGSVSDRSVVTILRSLTHPARQAKVWRSRQQLDRIHPSSCHANLYKDCTMTPFLSRREFFQITAGAAATAALGSIAPAADAKKIQKAIMYATIGYKGTVLEKFKAVKEAGFAGVEPMSHM